MFSIKKYPTLVLLSEGKMYKFNQEYDKANLVSFLNGGYNQTEGKPLNITSDYVSFVQKTVKYYWEKVEAVRTKNPVMGFILISQFVLSFFAIFCTVCYGCRACKIINRRHRSKQARQEKEKTATEIQARNEPKQIQDEKLIQVKKGGKGYSKAKTE